MKVQCLGEKMNRDFGQGIEIDGAGVPVVHLRLGLMRL